MIPAYEADGNLPAGIHWADQDEFFVRFGCNVYRRILLAGLAAGMASLKRAGCRAVYVDGSFVTTKAFPADYDCCWDNSGVDENLVDSVFFRFDNGRAAQKAKYLGEWFPASHMDRGTGMTFLQFFQIDKVSGEPKGIVALDLRRST